jgi:hypothetical protein
MRITRVGQALNNTQDMAQLDGLLEQLEAVIDSVRGNDIRNELHKHLLEMKFISKKGKDRGTNVTPPLPTAQIVK